MTIFFIGGLTSNKNKAIKNGKIPAVVYASNAPAGFGVIRSLYPYGIPIVGLDCYKNFAGLSRKFKAEICPDPAQNPDQFIDFIVNVGKKFGKAALFSSGDLSLYLFSKNKEKLEPYFYFPYLDEAQLEMGLDKWAMYRAAQKAGIPSPETFSPNNAEDIRKISFEFPVVIKPVTCQFRMGDEGPQRVNEFLNAYLYRKVLRAENLEQLLPVSEALCEKDLPFIVQEEIPGSFDQLYDVKFYVDGNGDAGEMFVGRKIRQMPADFGIGSLGENVHSDLLCDYTRRFLKAVDFRGLGDIEYKYDLRDGAFKFIEINPRATQQIFKATFSGINLPLRQYSDLTGIAVKPIPLSHHEVNWIMLEADLSYLAKYCFKKNSAYHLSFAQWFKSVFKKPLAETYLAWDDPALSLVYFFRCAGLFAMKLAKNAILALTGININKR